MPTANKKKNLAPLHQGRKRISKEKYTKVGHREQPQDFAGCKCKWQHEEDVLASSNQLRPADDDQSQAQGSGNWDAPTMRPSARQAQPKTVQVCP